ncbi:creatininase family protein [Streptomyces sp. NPDC093111]|uniref:creatininase family protein n=1 Tax=Streptomyces sp. NPDC093111 TaxID=3154978 RepID=UPI003432AFED
MLLGEITSPDLPRHAAGRHVIVPVGALEPHGPHLPLASDTMISEHFAHLLADDVNGVVAPSINYGVPTTPSRLGGTFPGVIAISGITFTALVTEILDSLVDAGFRRLIMVNSAIDNRPFLQEAARLVTRRSPDARIMIVHWWDVVGEDFRNALAEETGVARHNDHHAGTVESSLVFHISPQAARPELLAADGSEEQPRRIAYDVYPQPADTTTSSGIVYTAACASSELGKRVADRVARELAVAVRREFATLRPQ